MPSRFLGLGTLPRPSSPLLPAPTAAPSRAGSLSSPLCPLLSGRDWLGNPWVASHPTPPHRLPALWVAGISLFPPGAPPGFYPRVSRPLDPALSRRLSQLGGGGVALPRRPPRKVGLPEGQARAPGAPRVSQRRAVTAVRSGGLAGASVFPVSRCPGCCESRGPLPGPGLPLRPECGAGNAASEAGGRGEGRRSLDFGATAGVPFPRPFRSPWRLCPRDSGSFGLGLRVSLCPPPTCTGSLRGGRPGRGGGGGQEAGLVVIFGYLAV